ncbi:MAG: DEAD/DEAH box helicase [Candidatus Hydrogenedentes bacterium]|nr:DEAD/DEAH box helicase [Candidatus Hydrogenedentota bacterium]
MSRRKKETEKVLASLKDFQRRTVDYVFRRFYTDQNTTDRFLVADEVGLGKTMVAKGIIARAIEHLKTRVKRVDIVYVCSNISIASQNISRLTVSGVQEFIYPTRLTLLPAHLADIRNNKINYVSLTPGTSFDPVSRDGHVEERALIYHILQRNSGLSRAGLRHLLQCKVGDDNWRNQLNKRRSEGTDVAISKVFLRNIKADRKFFQRLETFCRRSTRRILWDDPDRLGLVFELRMRLAEVSVAALEPDLVILDEFQRFRNLLDENNPDARIAKKLFSYPDAKVLLLSATPYKMLSLDDEQEEDHYCDFLKTLTFLFGSEAAVEAIRKELQEFRNALYSLGEAEEGYAAHLRDSLQRKLLQVMCRTERAHMARAQDAMMKEYVARPEMLENDLHAAAFADSIATRVGARDVVEYWKSSPYLLNFLKKYELRRILEKQRGKVGPEVMGILSKNNRHMLRKQDIMAYREVDPANPRMRHLFKNTLDQGLWKILWMPPSMPYTCPGGAYAEIRDVTKSLVFSAWSAVPDAIATLCSYAAERRMLDVYRKKVRRVRHEVLYDKIHPLLRFARGRDDRVTGMPVLLLMYPSPALASLIDPLKIALNLGPGGPVSMETMLQKAEAIITPYVNEFTRGVPKRGIEDQRWYWALPALLDGRKFKEAYSWVEDGEEGWPSLSMDGQEDRGYHFREHLEILSRAMEHAFDTPLGRPPKDLARIVALVAVAAPGTCMLRALKRVAPNPAWDAPALLTGAATVSEGFRTLFNLPETIALLQGKDQRTPFWQLCLRHCLEGNMQSLLDEQVHCLVESLGLQDESETARCSKIGADLGKSLSIRTAPIYIDQVRLRPNAQKILFEEYASRCRFALRFGDMREQEEAAVKRKDVVLKAFNSPFRPFILASTSIGQEGLDFHTWCHAVTHWNLPANPVDLEQREGRIHRYKGHAIRKNIAKEYGLKALCKRRNDVGDPWHYMFELARKEYANASNELVPYWLFEVKGGAKIERHVPMLPFSREEGHFERLKKMLAIYRLIFGQPRQEDLLQYLIDKTEEKSCLQNLDNWRIILEPPRDK